MMHLESYKSFKKSCAFFMMTPCKASYIFIWFISLLLAVFFIWANIFPINTIVNASCEFKPEMPVSVVRSTFNGRITEVNYRNNSFVNKGDILVAFDSSVPELQLESYKEQYEQIMTEITVNDNLEKTIRNGDIPCDMTTSSAGYSACSSYVFQRKYYELLIDENRQKLEREKEAPEYTYVRQNVINLEYIVNQKIYEFETWNNKQLNDVLTRKKELQTSLAKLQSNIKECEHTIATSIIYAPITGKVNQIKQINQDDYIFSGEELLQIIPDEANNLIAKIYIDPVSIALVKEGNPVKIRIPSLSVSQYGQIETEISLIPPDTVFVTGNKEVYVVEAKILQKELISQKGQHISLISGMEGNCKIVTDKSTVMYKILQKLDFIE